MPRRVWRTPLLGSTLPSGRFGRGASPIQWRSRLPVWTYLGATDSLRGQSVRRWAVVLLGIVALTVLESRVVWLIHNPNITALALQCRGVTDGHPDWKAYQSRVIGPFGILLLSQAFHWTEERSYRVFGDVLMFAANLLAFGVGQRLSRKRYAGWALAVINAAVFIFTQDRHLYPWDFIAAVTMLLFAYGIWAGSGIAFFIVVFLVELLNRETAVFIALWLVFDGVVRLVRRNTDGLSRTMVGLMLAVGGSLWTRFVRDSLFLYQPYVWDDATLVFDQLLTWRRNIQLFYLSRDVAFTWVCLGTVSVALVQPWRRTSRLAPALTLLMAAILASNFLFAVITEPRIWISIAPLVIPLLVPQGATRGSDTAAPT